MDAANRALKEQNPFSQNIIRASHVWNESPPDIESLNAHASDAVFKTLDEIKAGHYPTTSLLITAQNGTGKSHIISRIRRHLKQNGKALFVLANRFNNLDKIKEGFQKHLAESLSHEGAHEVSQWQEIASKITLTSLENLKPSSKIPSTQGLVQKFTSKGVETAGKWIQRISDTFCRVNRLRDPEVIKAILWCLSKNEQPYAVGWLSGKELAQYKANELRLPSHRQSFDTVLQVLEVVSYFYELVVCFDELDYEDFNEQGLHRSQVIAGLIRELFENMNRGLILTTMMPGTWNGRVRQLPEGICNRITAQGKPYDLKHIDEQSITELVAFYLKNFYESKNIEPPHSLYPFDEPQLKEIGKEKPTAREVLKWCKENCKPQLEQAKKEDSTSYLKEVSTDSEGNTEENEVEEAFSIELKEDFQSYWEDNHLIGDALLFSLQRLLEKQIEEVEIISVNQQVKKRGGKDPYLNFKIYGKESNVDVCIGVAVLQDNGGRGLGAGFRRLLDETGDFGLSRGCLVRSSKKPLNPYFRTTYLEPLIKVRGGEFVDLKVEEIQPLVAIYNVHRKREEYGLTEEQIFEFIETAESDKILGIHSPLIQEILSAPSKQVPETADEPEVETADPEELLEEMPGNTSTLENLDDNSEADLDFLGDNDEDLTESDDLEDLVLNE